MPRRLASQVPQTVSRLLAGSYLKRPPVWYEPLLAHPPATAPPRAPVPRQPWDLPSALSPSSTTLPSQTSSETHTTSSRKRDPRNAQKRLRAQTPQLAPKPIVYAADRVRRQFYRDHPWEAFRPQTLVEMSREVQAPRLPTGGKAARELSAWGRNPGPEDVVACTLHLHENHGLSLSAAYHQTLSSYHSLRAEHETATRYAALEATYWGAEFGLSETERGFIKEERALNTWSQGVTGNAPDLSTAATASSGQSAQRIKRDDDTFTAGQAYLRAARAVRDGKASYAATPSTAVEHDTSAPSDLRDPSEDYLGVGADLTGRPPRREAGRAQAQVDAQAEMPDSSGRQGAVRQGPQQNVDASASEEGELVGELNDDQRWRNRVGTRGQRI